MPPLRAIERRRSNVWKSNEQKKRDDAQDEAARELARKAGEDDAEDEIPSDDDDDADDDAPAPPADPTVADDDAIQLQCDALSAVRVADLRRRLRENGRAELATVRASDLDAGLTGPEKSASTLLLLRRRLATVLVAQSS